MKRKLIKQGGGGFTIYLPKKWIDKNNLNQGNELEIVESNGSLSIYSEKRFIEKIIEINTNDKDRNVILKSIIAAYESGYSQIIIKHDKQTIFDPWKNKQRKIQDEINYVTNRLIGMEIINQTENKIVIGDLIKEHIEEFKSIFNRMIHLQKCYCADILEFLDSKNKSEINNFEIQHDNLTKLASYVIKILNSTKEVDDEIKSNYLILIYNIEKINDSLRFLARDLCDDKVDLNSETKAIKKIMENLKLMLKLMIRFDESIINLLDKERAELNKEIRNKFNNYQVWEILEYIQGMIKPIISLNLKNKK